MTPTRRRHLALALLAGPLVLGGCDFGEPRPFNYEKGTYLGKPHVPLGDATLTALRTRTALQSDPGFTPPTGGGTPANVRPPSPDPTRHRAAYGTPTGSAGGSRSVTGGSGASSDTLRRRTGRQGNY